MSVVSGDSREMGARRLDGASPSPQAAVPDQPLIVVQPRSALAAIDLRELWTHRELLYFLTWRDVKIRYKQTALGAAWAVLQPVFTMLIFTLIFSRVARIGSDGIPYPIFAYAGLVPWIFFSNAVTLSGNSIVGSSHLITKVYFPRLFIPAASVAAGVVDLLVASALFVPLLIYYDVNIGPNALLLPLLLVMIVLLAFGVGVWLSALNVKFRDIRFTIPFLLQVGMFASPVAYPSSVVPEAWRTLYFLNPAAGIIEGFRSALFGTPINWAALAISAGVTAVILVCASITFRKMERAFADII